METLSASHASKTDLRFLVRGVSVVKTYYAFWGRNAWWSTWITRYSEGCIHTQFDSVRQYCEARRVQGTVFFVNDLPAIAFQGGTKALLVTEINTSDPLSRFDRSLLETLTRLIPVLTMTLEQLSHVFKARSEFWPCTFRRENSVVLTLCDDTSSLKTISDSEEFVARTSESIGTDYDLRWSSRPSGIRHVAVVRLAEDLNARLRAL